MHEWLTRQHSNNQTIKQSSNQGVNLLMMSSGNFDGIDFNQLAEEVLI